MKLCAQRKAGRRQRARRRFACRLYPSHGLLRFITSYLFRARLCHAKNEAPEEEADVRARNFKGSENWATKKHLTCHATLLQNELYSNVARFTTNMKPVLQQIRLLTGLNVGGKTRNIAIQLVSCRNVAKKVARFLLSVFPQASCELLKFIQTGYLLMPTSLALAR